MELHILAGLPIGLREMLEALLITLLVLKILKKENLLKTRKQLIKENNYSFKTIHKTRGFFSFTLIFFSFFISSVFGYGIYELLNFISSELNSEVKIIEAILALILAPFLIHFLLHIMKIKRGAWKVKAKYQALFWYGAIVFFSVFRESFEVSFLFFGRSLANNSEQQLFEAYGIIVGICIAVILIVLLQIGSLKISIKWILNITTVYLIIQIAYVIGYAFHEISEYIVAEQISNNPFFLPAYNLRNTIASKNEPIGIILNVLFGYYDKSEWLMIFTQTLSLVIIAPVTFVLSKDEYIKKIQATLQKNKAKVRKFIDSKNTPKKKLAKKLN